MSKVYLVSQGSYSDYHIVGVFSTEEKAKEFVKQADAIDYGFADSHDVFELSEPRTITEWELDIEAEKPAPGAFRAQIEIGKLMGKYTVSIIWCEGDNPQTPARVETNTYGIYKNQYAVGWGETREHALRSARELERAVIAGTVVLP